MVPKNHKGIPDDRDQDGSSGQGGKIEFHDFMADHSSRRDDQLPPDVIKSRLSEHQHSQKDRVKRQEQERKLRQEIKAGNKSLKEHKGLSAGMNANILPHPILSQKLRGVDVKVSPNPSENAVQTNEANRDELQHKYQLRHQPQLSHRPKFDPKPQR